MCYRFVLGFLSLLAAAAAPLAAEDHYRQLQQSAVENKLAPWGHWGPDASRYSSWGSHSNRLIPVYTFGIGLESVCGDHSVYRSAAGLEQLYGRVPPATVNPEATYFDQTDVYRLQVQAAAAGKKHIILIVFDGMDWQTTWLAAMARSGKFAYREGRGTGLHFQDYRGAATDFGYFVTSPHNDGTDVDTDAQTVANPSGKTLGGFDPRLGGAFPWSAHVDGEYLIGKNRQQPHAYTDSASSATSLCSGIKTYNDSVNVDFQGKQVEPIAQQLQTQGWQIGVVTSVPISHATPACAYANNVHRDDYQDLTRDMLGLPSVAHKEHPLPGVDVLLGAGWGDDKPQEKKQGSNFVPGNRYITSADLAAVDATRGGKYVVVQRTPGSDGADVLAQGAAQAIASKQRLLGIFGYKSGHLPFQTADGNYDPSPTTKAEQYQPADIRENPTLAKLTQSALDVLTSRGDRFWLMVEAGDVDWANHANEIDCSIGATLSGDAAFRVVTEWAEKHDRWKDTAVIVTADHGHYLVIDHPELLLPAAATSGGP